MPVSPTYPGVYIQEIPSGVRTITGVATSIAAFVGRAARGPVNTPVTITSFADFERIFGGLTALSRLGYAVRDFYQNGGTTAIIVRLTHSDAAKAAIPLPGGPPTLTAANEGAWGNTLHAVVDNNVSLDVANQFLLTTADLFSGARSDLAGRFDGTNGECYWTQDLHRRHEVYYRGFREGKGIWGLWELPNESGGFRIWPLGQGVGEQNYESAEEPAPVEAVVVET